MMSAGNVIDVSDSTFEHEVIEASRSRPVVVDFWAAWCGPCRALGPLLEETALRTQGVTLAKLDTDANPGTAMRFSIRGIPAVKAFRDGRVADEFVGLQSKPFVERFFASLAPAVAEDLPDGESGLVALLERSPDSVPARRALGRLLIAQGRLDEAAAVLRPALPDPVADGLAARVDLLRDAVPLPSEIAHPDGAAELVAVHDLISAIGTARGEARDRLRRVAIGILADQADNPAVAPLRSELASALF